MAFPRILNWHFSQVPRFEKATELFDHRDYPVHGLMNVTEVEHAYIGNLALDVHHDSTPYNVAPAVRDKPPQASHDEKDEGIPLTRSGISKKRKEASVEIMGKGGRRRMGHKPTDQPSSSTAGVAAHVHVEPTTPSQPPTTPSHDEVPLRERLTILEGEVASVRQDVKDLRIAMLREFASLDTKLDKLMKHQGVGVSADGLGDGMDGQGDENKGEYGPDATPVDRQSQPYVDDDAGPSVTIIEKVSPSKFPAGRRAAKQNIDIGRRDRKAAAAITTPYSVGGLRKKLQRTLLGASSTLKFDPYKPVPTRLVKNFDKFMMSGWASKVDMDILTVGKDFFQLLINSEKWLNHDHMEVLPYLFRVRANQFPDIFDPSFEVLDGGFWVYIEQCHGKFIDNPSKFQFSYAMQEYGTWT
ncbi:uncharacterized protein LOC125424086 [Ziziphus jujuba]|uniref:Uncharacterized protein LOC125424086 n=1 Tax=Ziziphus jujuba TaxID=326968 RepID=A0ABM4AHU7_ZIZJJ|nr:uncharacterized protein LOC125424086 [Ziziphus jujuba]